MGCDSAGWIQFGNHLLTSTGACWRPGGMMCPNPISPNISVISHQSQVEQVCVVDLPHIEMSSRKCHVKPLRLMGFI